MGWFWADPVCPAPPASRPPHVARDGSPPPSCPMHKRTAEALACKRSDSSPPPSACPVPHGGSNASEPSTLSKLNPLNYMFHTLSQSPASSQTYSLPTTRDESSIPKGTPDGERWEYPSPQQMYNALLRKGYTDTDVTAVESMVSIHNFLNEGAWAEIVDWERRFGKGLRRGWEVSRRGEENAEVMMRRLEAREGGEAEQPSLLRFQGRPKDMTPKAAVLQALGWAWPGRFGTEPPFDRHDWYVGRNVDGEVKEVRYIIDYYSGGEEPTGEPVFFLDVRPAVTPTAAVERLMRWGGDVWWKAAGGEVRWGDKPAPR